MRLIFYLVYGKVKTHTNHNYKELFYLYVSYQYMLFLHLTDDRSLISVPAGKCPLI